MNLSCWDHFFEDLTEIQPYIWREVHPILQHMLSFLHQFSVCISMKTNGLKMTSFVNVTLKSALLEITDARNRYSNIPK